MAAKAHLGISMIITVGVTNRTHLGISTMMATAAAGWEEVSGAIPKEVAAEAEVAVEGVVEQALDTILSKFPMI